MIISGFVSELRGVNMHLLALGALRRGCTYFFNADINVHHFSIIKISMAASF